MFTGLIEEIGQVIAFERKGQTAKVKIRCKKVLEGTKIGDSISVNGVCLTVTDLNKVSFACEMMPETINSTTFAATDDDTYVNLERAIAVGERLGGHFVQGHVDGVGSLIKRDPLENAVLFTFQLSPKFTYYMIDKGSVAVHGVSMTLQAVNKTSFTISVIPHTLEKTIFNKLTPGDKVNIECDMVGKYLAKWNLEKVRN